MYSRLTDRGKKEKDAVIYRQLPVRECVLTTTSAAEDSLQNSRENCSGRKTRKWRAVLSCAVCLKAPRGSQLKKMANRKEGEEEKVKNLIGQQKCTRQHKTKQQHIFEHNLKLNGGEENEKP